MLAQWAHAATIAEADVIEERGVVRDELRLRYETGSGIINRIFDRAYTEDTPYEGYHPIGTAEVIEAMTPDMLRDFYELWYVPSNMALIAVGDLPVDELEALVQEHFGDIPAGEAPPEPDKFSPISPEPVYLIATSPSWSYSYMSLDMKIPTWEGDTAEGERARLAGEPPGPHAGRPSGRTPTSRASSRRWTRPSGSRSTTPTASASTARTCAPTTWPSPSATTGRWC